MRGRYNNRFTPGWWNRRPIPGHLPAWHPWRWNGWHSRPHYWWRWATWGGVTNWMAGTWGEPIYYDYGGNVYYEDNNVYLDGQQYCTEEQYADQASTIAQTVPEVKDDKQVQWLPLGVFALTDQEKGDANMMLQLAVSKEGIIAGTYTNESTDSTAPVQGSVDPKTQRAAWTIGDNKNTVLETGIYNLTNNQTPVLVHFGKDNTQTWLMVRLDEPKDEKVGTLRRTEQLVGTTQ